jgi:hypothetical protein
MGIKNVVYIRLGRDAVLTERQTFWSVVVTGCSENSVPL